MSEDVRHPLFARVYARLGPRLDQQGTGEHRERLLAGLRGRVIEVGAGSGLNFGRYPDAVTDVLAVEPEPYLRRLAEVEARSARASIRVVPGRAERLPAADGSQDAAVLSLVLCSVGDQRRALVEVVRVLRPGGEVRLYEHVVSGSRGVTLVQRLLDLTVWPALVGGCHLARDTRRAVEESGLTVDRWEPVAMPGGSPGGLVPHVLGVAHRP